MSGGLPGGLGGWRQFWRRLRRRNGWGRRNPWPVIRFIEVPRPAAPEAGGGDAGQMEAGEPPAGPAQADPQGSGRQGSGKPARPLFPGAPRPAEPLPGKRPGDSRLPGRQTLSRRPAEQLPGSWLQGGEPRREMLQALVQALGVRRADPLEAEAYLRAWLELSSRQQQVVALVCAGHTNREIAKRLHLSPNTVKSHLALALGRFGLRSRTELRVALAGWDFSRMKLE